MKLLAWIAGAMAVALAVVVGLVFFLAGGEDDALLTEAPCVPAGLAGLPQAGTGTTLTSLTAEQSANVRTIVAVAAQVGAGRQGAIVAVATAWQESTLRNLGYGDRVGPDSRGLFQQRDPWGTLAERTTPATAAALFFNGGRAAGTPGLLAIPGWQTMPVWAAAQKVQRSAFPTAYAKWTERATALVDQVLADGGITMPRVDTPSADCAGSVEQLTGACAPSGLGIESQVTPDARNVVRCVVQNMPTKYGIGGYANRNVAGTTKKSDHASGRAIDVMVSPSGPNGGTMPNAEQKAYGDKVAQYAIDNCAAFGCTYVIWYGRIWNPTAGWRPYTHPSGANTVTFGHFDHVHVSVRGTAGTLLTAAAPSSSQFGLAA